MLDPSSTNKHNQAAKGKVAVSLGSESLVALVAQETVGHETCKGHRRQFF
jgi:hypothetical protein